MLAEDVEMAKADRHGGWFSRCVSLDWRCMAVMFSSARLSLALCAWWAVCLHFVKLNGAAAEILAPFMSLKANWSLRPSSEPERVLKDRLKLTPAITLPHSTHSHTEAVLYTHLLFFIYKNAGAVSVCVSLSFFYVTLTFGVIFTAFTIFGS